MVLEALCLGCSSDCEYMCSSWQRHSPTGLLSTSSYFCFYYIRQIWIFGPNHRLLFEDVTTFDILWWNFSTVRVSEGRSELFVLDFMQLGKKQWILLVTTNWSTHMAYICDKQLFLPFVWFCLSVFCLFVIVIIITCIYSGDQLWWCIPSGSLSLYCFSLQLFFFYCG